MSSAGRDAAAGFSGGVLPPAIERRTGNADRSRRLLGVEAVAARSQPSRHGVASSRGFDIGGLRREKTRRRPAVLDNLTGQAKNLHGGSPEVG